MGTSFYFNLVDLISFQNSHSLEPVLLTSALYCKTNFKFQLSKALKTIPPSSTSQDKLLLLLINRLRSSEEHLEGLIQLTIPSVCQVLEAMSSLRHKLCLGPPVCSNTLYLYCTFCFGSNLERFPLKGLCFSKCIMSVPWQNEICKMALVTVTSKIKKKKN